MASENKPATVLSDYKVHVKLKIALLWVTIMFCGRFGVFQMDAKPRTVLHLPAFACTSDGGIPTWRLLRTASERPVSARDLASQPGVLDLLD
jgi:hypothetical protein